MSAPRLVWLRADLRLADHPALHGAAAGGAPVIPVFLFDERVEALGGAARWWLHGSLAALEEALARRGSRLVLRRGPAAGTLLALARESGAEAVCWNRCHTPREDAADAVLARTLKSAGVAPRRYGGDVLADPETFRNRSGRPFQVFTPFWKALAAEPVAPPLPEPAALTPPPFWPAGESLDAWNLRPLRPDWAAGLRAAWTPGEDAAGRRLAAFAGAGLADYAARRDALGEAGTSRLSPSLAWGELSPRQVWHALRGRPGSEPFLRQLAWREFSRHLLHHFPRLPEAPLRGEFAAFPWREDDTGLAAWQRGRTGYPVVDAGMRELWHTGWMHNRARMVAASFLVKHLLLPWQVGAAWFLDTLVDADLANNSAGWQWVAGCGADAAPYFRIFNPVAQGERFDPAGAYVRRWVPELAGLPDRFIHRPWEADAATLARAGVRLGEDYPLPRVEHAAARARALAAFAALRQGPGV